MSHTEKYDCPAPKYDFFRQRGPCRPGASPHQKSKGGGGKREFSQSDRKEDGRERETLQGSPKALFCLDFWACKESRIKNGPQSLATGKIKFKFSLK